MPHPRCAGECAGTAEELAAAQAALEEATLERDALAGQLEDLRADQEELAAAHAALGCISPPCPPSPVCPHPPPPRRTSPRTGRNGQR